MFLSGYIFPAFLVPAISPESHNSFMQMPLRSNNLPKTLVTNPRGNCEANRVSIQGAAYRVGATSCLSKWRYNSRCWSCRRRDSWYNCTCSAVMSGRYCRRKPRRNIRWRSKKKADSSDICNIMIRIRNILCFLRNLSCMISWSGYYPLTCSSNTPATKLSPWQYPTSGSRSEYAFSRLNRASCPGPSGDEK